jgi:hypothetical protein
MCPGTNNRVADLRRLKSDQDHVIDYLDQHCKLFDQRAGDLNKISNIVNLLGREGVIIKPVEETIYDFIAMHRKCGFYMYVDPMDEEVGPIGE